MFDNAPSHQWHAPDAISACRMVKSEFFFFNHDACVDNPSDPKLGWTQHKGGPPMHHGFIPQTGEPQSFYFPSDHPIMPGWFKGMEQIIWEHGLWPEGGLPSECLGF